MNSNNLSETSDRKIGFPLGQMYLTRGVFNECESNPNFYLFVNDSIRRHSLGDWGDMDAEDKAENEFALGKRSRIFSAYKYQSSNKKIWIITEADRSCTTVLFPDEY